MGRGEARRRRLVNALKAKTEKKGKAFVGSETGQKKTKKTNKGDQDVPSSFRKLLMLKAAAERQGKKRSEPGPRQQPGAPAAVTKTVAAQQAQQADGQLAKHSGEQISASPAGLGIDHEGASVRTADGQHLGHAGSPVIAATVADHEPEQQDSRKQRAQQKVRETQREQRQQQQTGQGPGGVKKKSLRADKKEFLKLKKLRRKHKLKVDELLVEKERELLAKQSSSRPQFGEQAAQPIQVNLKRKHWNQQQQHEVDQTPAQGAPGRKSAANARCTQLFQKQMQAAEQRLASGAAAAAAAPAGGVAAAGSSKLQRSPKGQDGKQAATRKGAAGKAAGKGKQQAKAGKLAAGVTEQERLQLIEAYRQAKRAKLEATGHGLGVSATPQSLAELVQREAIRAVTAQQAQQA